MKTSRGFASFASSAVAGAWMLFGVGLGSLQAAGGGGFGVVGGAGAVTGGGGGHGGAVASSGGGHAASAPASGHAGGNFSSVGSGGGGIRSTGGSLRPVTATYSGQPHDVSSGFGPNVTMGRASVASVNAGRAVIANPSVGQTTVGPARNVSGAPAARVRNAWTDPAPDATITGRNQNNFTGTVLYPSAGHGVVGDRYQARPGNNEGSTSHGRYGNGFRNHRRGYGYHDGYGYGYPGVLLGGYGYAPYFYGDSLGLADPAGDYAIADVPGNVGASDAPSPAAVDALSQPYATATVQPPVPDAADGGSDNNAPQPSAAGPSNPNNGPDSLVEAVQAELSRRGYFGGKIDSIYNDATHTAIQRFQKDQKLPASGRINEATLHALQLD